jgi:hypothetical protein
MFVIPAGVIPARISTENIIEPNKKTGINELITLVIVIFSILIHS